MNHLKIKLVVLALVAISLLVLFGGSAPILADSPNPIPTAALPTPVVKPTSAAVSPAQKVPTRALVAPTQAPSKAVAPAARSSAAAFAAYSSSINLMNLSSSAATISIAYNDQNTNASGGSFSTTVAGNGSAAYFPIQGANTGFVGSAVISSNQPLASIVNVVALSGSTIIAGGSYDGATGGEATIQAPLLMKNNSGYNTRFNVQNAGSSDASVTATYSDGTSAGPFTIHAGYARQFDQAAETHTKTVFSGVVSNSSTNQPLVVSVLEENPSTIFAYTGFGSTGTSTTPAIPLVNSNNHGWITGIQVQNSGGSSTNVTLSYTPAAGSGNGTACTESQTVPAGQSKTFALYAFTAGNPQPPGGGMTTNCAGGSRFVGAAKVTTNSANMSLSVVVNQLLPGLMGEAYGGFNPSNATNKVVLPLIMDRRSGWFTGINIMNVGAATTVHCTFTNSAVTFNTSLGAGAVFNLITNNFIQNNYAGAGTCTGANAGDKLVGVVNELNSAAGDNLLVYEGINQ